MKEGPRFDVAQQPATPQQHAKWRSACEVRMDKSARFNVRARWLAGALGALAGVVDAAAYHTTWGPIQGEWLLAGLNGAGVGAMVFAIAIILPSLVRGRRLEEDALSAEVELGNLVELDCGRHRRACIEFARWCDDHEMVGAYQRNIAAQGRMPVRGEYLAARHWAKKAREQARQAERRERAERARDRLRAS